MGKSSSTNAEQQSVAAEQWLLRLFFLSGVAALAYQVCWQRILFFSLGTDIESTTIIISTFMLGLGLGALMGGWAADRFSAMIIPLFAFAELGIGAFGFVSPYLLPSISDMFIQSGRGEMAAINFLLLLPPTCLMGGTLPMLITHCLKAYGSVGASTGRLYCANTLGAALGCFLVGFIGFNFLTLKEVTLLAACINIFVASTALLKFRETRT